VGLLLKPQRGNGIIIGQGDDAILVQFTKVSGGISFNFYAMDTVPLRRLSQEEVSALVSEVSAPEVRILIDALSAARRESDAKKGAPPKPQLEKCT
jgi:hypothetical protein